MQSDVLIKPAAIEDYLRIVGDPGRSTSQELTVQRIVDQVIDQLQDQYFMMCRRLDEGTDEERNDFRPTTRFVRLCDEQHIWAQLFSETDSCTGEVSWGVRRLWHHDHLKEHWTIVDRASLAEHPSVLNEVVPEVEPEPKTQRNGTTAEEYESMAIHVFVAAGTLSQLDGETRVFPEDLITVGKKLLALGRS